MTTLRDDSGARGRSPARAGRRPRDRKAQITRAAAEVFSAQGFHMASMEAIAAKVGISAPALYRHYPSKYVMFVNAVLALGQQLVDCTDFVDAESDDDLAVDPGAVLGRLVGALVEVALLNRESGGLYHWQDRYLNADDHATLSDQLRAVNRRIQRPLLMIRPTLTALQRRVLSAGLLSVTGSVVGDRLVLQPEQIHAVLDEAVAALLAAKLPEPQDVEIGPLSVWRIFPPEGGTHETLVREAMTLFGERGYAETSMAQIADAAGVPVSGIYRHFSGKYEILTTGLRRAGERALGEFAAIEDVFTEPRQMLSRLIEAYVATSVANPELSAVYLTERVNLTAADQERVRRAEEGMAESWVRPLTSVRPGLDAARARVLVRAAMVLVADLGRMFRSGELGEYTRTPAGAAYAQACMRNLMECTVFGSEG